MWRIRELGSIRLWLSRTLVPCPDEGSQPNSDSSPSAANVIRAEEFEPASWLFLREDQSAGLADVDHPGGFDAIRPAKVHGQTDVLARCDRASRPQRTAGDYQFCQVPLVLLVPLHPAFRQLGHLRPRELAVRNRLEAETRLPAAHRDLRDEQTVQINSQRPMSEVEADEDALLGRAEVGGPCPSRSPSMPLRAAASIPLITPLTVRFH